MITRLDRQDKFLCSNTGGIFWDEPNHFRGCKQLYFYFSITLFPLKKNSRGQNMVFQLIISKCMTFHLFISWRVQYIGDIQLCCFMKGVVYWWHTSMLFRDRCGILVTSIYVVSWSVWYIGDILLCCVMMGVGGCCVLHWWHTSMLFHDGCCILVTYIYAVSWWVLYTGDIHLCCFMIGVVYWWHTSMLLAAAWGEVARHSSHPQCSQQNNSVSEGLALHAHKIPPE